ncbi:MAG: type II toxin-antitoxin system HicB family antitoxin [Caulobacteraceae bacterium]|nr:type II toxin-antitoxin system HicB family antitoxin [Caulobacteraceae bacterium]
MRQYIALIHKDADSDFGVSFPDLPGCVTAGRTLDEARDMAAEALALHLEGLAEDGDAIPDPSSLEAVMSDPENRSGVAILVAAPVVPARAVRINITLPEDVLERIDAFAEKNGYSRSGFLAYAARKAMAA